MGLATLLLRPQGAGTSTMGGRLADWTGEKAGAGVDWLSQLLQSIGGSDEATQLAGPSGPGIEGAPAGLGLASLNGGGGLGFDPNEDVNLGGLGGNGGDGLGMMTDLSWLNDPSWLDALQQNPNFFEQPIFQQGGVY